MQRGRPSPGLHAGDGFERHKEGPSHPGWPAWEAASTEFQILPGVQRANKNTTNKKPNKSNSWIIQLSTFFQVPALWWAGKEHEIHKLDAPYSSPKHP